MKTNAENLRLFQEARTLKESMRSNIHSKATNSPINQQPSTRHPPSTLHNKAVKRTR